MGGIGNLRGAVLGGLIIGFIQQISDNRIGSQWTPAVVFAYLILIMTFKPSGLLGEPDRGTQDERRRLPGSRADRPCRREGAASSCPAWAEKIA